MDFKEIINFSQGLGYPIGIGCIIVVLIRCFYGYILRKTPIERTKRYTDENGNPVEITEKFRH